MGDKDTVVGDRNTRFLSAVDPVMHFAAIQHAGAAMDDHAIGCKVGRVCAAAGEDKFDVFSGMLANPAGEFDGAYVVALAVMRAAFCDKDPVAVL